MKKRHLLSVAVLFSSMLGFAQNSLSMDDVKIAPGQTAQVSVNLNNSTAYTAFQFDMTLPEGITVEDVTLAERASGHTLKKGTVNGKYRILAYSYNEETNKGNEPITGTEGAIVNLTLKAGESIAEGATIVIDAGNQSQDGGQVFVEADGTTNYSMDEVTAAVTEKKDVTIKVGTTGKSTYVGDEDLDFSSLEDLKAYIATGYDKSKNTIWLTRVKDVPAGTPIMLIGPKTQEATNYIVPISNSRTYYPENYLKGSATGAVTVDKSGKYLNMALMSGTFGELTDATFPKGKSYLQLPATLNSNPGTAFTFTMGSKGKKSYVGKYDLDFTNVEDLNAYTVTGYDKKKTIWLSRVKKVPAGTPLYLIGTANKSYEIPSVGVQSSYINMLRGNAENSTVLPMNSTIESVNYTNCVLQGGQFNPLGAEEPSFPAGVAYLPIPTSYIVAASRGYASEINNFMGIESEVICMSLGNFSDDETTSINRIASEVDNDVWYDLKGQRINTPTRKGLYIKNGKKVVVK